MTFGTTADNLYLNIRSFDKEETMQPGFPKKLRKSNASSSAHMIEGYLSDRAAREGLPKGGYPNNGGLPKPNVDSLEMETSFVEAFRAKPNHR